MLNRAVAKGCPPWTLGWCPNYGAAFQSVDHQSSPDARLHYARAECSQAIGANGFNFEENVDEHSVHITSYYVRGTPRQTTWSREGLLAPQTLQNSLLLGRPDFSPGLPYAEGNSRICP